MMFGIGMGFGSSGGGAVVVTYVSNKRFSFTRGDNVQVIWTSESDDQWPDLTGASLKFRMSAYFGSLEHGVSIDQPTGSQAFSISLTKVESLVASGRYKYDVQATLSSGEVHTLAKGQAVVEVTYTDATG